MLLSLVMIQKLIAIKQLIRDKRFNNREYKMYKLIKF